MARQHHPRAARQRHARSATSTSSSVTGLTSNPTIFDQAIKSSTDYDADIRAKLKAGKSGEALFFELALDDITRAADLFRPIYDRTCGVDGWVSLEVSPLLAYDTKTTIAVGQGPLRPRRAAQPLHQDPRHQGRPAGDRGGDLRRRAGQRDAAVLAPSTTWRPPRPTCAASSGASPPASTRTSRRSRRCSSAAGTARSPARCPPSCVNKLGIAIGQQRVQGVLRPAAPRRATCGVMNAGARPQRLLLASTGTKDPEGLRHPVHQGAGRAAHREHDARGTLKAFADHGEVGAPVRADGGDCEAVLAAFAQGRHRPRRAGGEAADRRRGVVRQVVERADGRDRLQERGAGKVG